jgi:heme/copper-type cytochrome/quinol oxidase subunit 2
MNLDTLLSTVILVTFIVTIILAVGSYAAYKLRERRRSGAVAAFPADEPVFFKRFVPPDETARLSDVDVER